MEGFENTDDHNVVITIRLEPGRYIATYKAYQKTCTMKPNPINLICTLSISFAPFMSFSQYNPGLPAAFGIDGDVVSGQSLNISGSLPLGSFDWFRSAGSGTNIGIGVIDTSGAALYRAQIAAGNNVTFSRGMSFPRYSTQNGYLLLDSRYNRDNFALSNSGGNNDLTTYTNGSKNADNPSGWSTTPSGSTVADKVDIIDTYIHMRRDGTVINNTNPSHLILAMGVSTLGNTGNRYVDFELFRSRIAYDKTTGLFSNSGPSATGGHSEWRFNANGTISAMGDLAVAFSYSTSGVSDISVYIWTSIITYSSISPSTFKFVAGEFYGAAYGYAKISPLAASPILAWGSASTAITISTPWGTNSKSIGNSPNNYYSANYDAYNFGETAVDLTSLGIDPALSVGMDACSPPFTRVMTKSRSSAAFTSALQDFTEPQVFLDAPQISSQIATPTALKCNLTSTILSPATTISGAYYQWSTNTGNIVSDPNAADITVNKAGTYYLTSSIVVGCSAQTDSVIVNADYYKPIASAFTTGILIAGDTSTTANLVGGDVAQSNYNTPYGGSIGLGWNWTGPNGYTANIQSPSIKDTGTYTLVLTEQRNGCSDTAQTQVTYSNLLSSEFSAFSAVKKDNQEVLLKWNVANNTPGQLQLMRSYNGIDFTVVGQFTTMTAGSKQNYTDIVNDRPGKYVYYKLKKINTNSNVQYSKTIVVLFNDAITINDISTAPNPAINYTVLNIKSKVRTPSTIQLVDLSGRLLQQKIVILEIGSNHVLFNGLEKLQAGIYMLLLSDNNSMIVEKFLKSN